jgi:hypothetical protein
MYTCKLQPSRVNNGKKCLKLPWRSFFWDWLETFLIMKGAAREPVSRANSAPKLMQSILKSNQQPLSGRERNSSSSLRSLRDFSQNSQKPTDKDSSKNFFSSNTPSREDSPVQESSSNKISFSPQPQKLNADEDDPGRTLKLDLEMLVRELRQIGFDKKDPLPINIM